VVISLDGDVNNGNVQEATLSIASVVDSFTSVCSVDVANGAKTFHVDVVQSVVGLSIVRATFSLRSTCVRTA
jgi:hypothetical protein